MKTKFNFFGNSNLLVGVSFAILYVSILFSGCGEVGLLAGGSINQFTGSYRIKLDTTQTNIYDFITSVGKEMDMSLYGLDTTSHKIVLSSGYSTAAAGLIGKSSEGFISVVLTNSLHDLSVGITLQGNFGYGTKENADKIFSEFKEKLLAKLKKS